MLVLPDRAGDGGLRSIEARLDEAGGLAEAIGIEVVGRKAFRLRQVRQASVQGCFRLVRNDNDSCHLEDVHMTIVAASAP